MELAVPDEYIERYRRVAHPTLYRQLLAGDPGHVERVAGDWHVAAASVRAIAADLVTNVAALGQSWRGAGARVYEQRMARLAAWAEDLADEAAAMQTGLSIMSSALTTARREAESAPAEDGQWAFDGLLGPALGRLTPAPVRARLHEQLVEVVAGLAVEYALAEHKVWHGPRPDPAPEDPGSRVDTPVPADTAVPAGTSEVAGSRVPRHDAPAPGDRVANHESPVSTLAGAGTGLAGAATTHLIGGRIGETSGAAGPTALPPMLGAPMLGAPMLGAGTAAVESADGSRRWRADATAVDSAAVDAAALSTESIAWAEHTADEPRPAPAT